ncbi:cytochrome c/FTR1 family iron permease [Chromatiaceae bacterium AAb-1]|nr:cytochrome c/FTR1 family iron permease [Chromatiaceae bacterium AAb-1]
MYRFALLLICLLLSLPLQASDRLIQLIEYIGADYSEAVQQGEIVSEAEYAEMTEFAGLVVHELEQAQASAGLQQQARQLQQLVADKADAEQIKQLTAIMRKQVVQSMPVIPVPERLPDLQHGKALYATNCATCHGAEGKGDGPAAAGLDPAPTDFHDTERYSARSLFGLFNTISLGVEDTAMVAFSHLDQQSRWDLAFYAGSLASLPQDTTEAPAALINKAMITELLTSTPRDLEEQYDDAGLALMALFRRQPENFFNAAAVSPLQIAQEKLQLALDVLPDNPQSAYELAVSAYLDGFELVENNLAAVDPQLKDQIENSMLRLRQQIKQQPQQAAEAIRLVLTQLEQAAELLDNSVLSAFNVFILALLILLREGLEALLVVAAIYSVAVKTEQPTLKRSVHYGWIAALALGAVTWFAASYLITISGASRELTEGYTALIAAAVLFYMGFWMHSKTSAVQWQKFISSKVEQALSSGAYFGLGVVVFLAVYREVFETILFYQSLWMQGGAAHQSSFIAGIAAALVLMLIIGLMMFRFALKLPLKAFFGTTALFMMLLAIIMTGKGIAALQEAGTLAMTSLDMPSVGLLGIYPTAEGLAAQAIMLFMAVLFLIRQAKKQ